MHMMANKDEQLLQYRQFFEHFAKTHDPRDQLPVKINSYKLINVEVVGAVIDWSLQYLTQKGCPRNIISILVRKIIDEVRQLGRKDPIMCGFNPEDNAYDQLKLMQKVIAQTSDVCHAYLDNSMLSILPECSNTFSPLISVGAVKNKRRQMEDRHVVMENLNEIFGKDCSQTHYYAVFDGHAGTHAAAYSAVHLHQFFAESEYFYCDVEKALKEAFHKTDNLFGEKCKVELLRGGTTAVCAVLRPKDNRLFIAWVGDSMALLGRQGELIQYVQPHKPDREDERQRIEQQGGNVIHWSGTWRVDGQLAVSRAIGDSDYKPYVPAEPDFHEVILTGNEDFLILACDGLWDFVTEEETASIVYQRICADPENTHSISGCLVEQSKYNNCCDNISVIVVILRDPHIIAATAEAQRWATCTFNMETTGNLATGTPFDSVTTPPATTNCNSNPFAINLNFGATGFTNGTSRAEEDNNLLVDVMSDADTIESDNNAKSLINSTKGVSDLNPAFKLLSQHAFSAEPHVECNGGSNFTENGGDQVHFDLMHDELDAANVPPLVLATALINVENSQSNNPKEAASVQHSAEEPEEEDTTVLIHDFYNKCNVMKQSNAFDDDDYDYSTTNYDKNSSNPNVPCSVNTDPFAGQNFANTQGDNEEFIVKSDTHSEALIHNCDESDSENDSEHEIYTGRQPTTETYDTGETKIEEGVQTQDSDCEQLPTKTLDECQLQLAEISVPDSADAVPATNNTIHSNDEILIRQRDTITVEDTEEEDEEDEWNYIKGDQGSDIVTVVNPSVDNHPVDQPVNDIRSEETDDNMSQLNPNAAEFVPITPPTITSPSCRYVIQDDIITQSPKNYAPMDINLPSEDEFDADISRCPHEISDSDSPSNQVLAQNLINAESTNNALMNGHTLLFDNDDAKENDPPLVDKANTNIGIRQSVVRSNLFGSEDVSTTTDAEHSQFDDPVIETNAASIPLVRINEDLDRLHQLPEDIDAFLAEKGHTTDIVDFVSTTQPEILQREPAVTLNHSEKEIVSLHNDKEDGKELASPKPEDDDDSDNATIEVQPQKWTRTPDLLSSGTALSESSPYVHSTSKNTNVCENGMPNETDANLVYQNENVSHFAQNSEAANIQLVDFSAQPLDTLHLPGDDELKCSQDEKQTEKSTEYISSIENKEVYSRTSTLTECAEEQSVSNQSTVAQNNSDLILYSEEVHSQIVSELAVTETKETIHECVEHAQDTSEVICVSEAHSELPSNSNLNVGNLIEPVTDVVSSPLEEKSKCDVTAKKMTLGSKTKIENKRTPVSTPSPASKVLPSNVSRTTVIKNKTPTPNRTHLKDTVKLNAKVSGTLTAKANSPKPIANVKTSATSVSKITNNSTVTARTNSAPPNKAFKPAVATKTAPKVTQATVSQSPRMSITTTARSTASRTLSATAASSNTITSVRQVNSATTSNKHTVSGASQAPPKTVNGPSKPRVPLSARPTSTKPVNGSDKSSKDGVNKIPSTRPTSAVSKTAGVSRPISATTASVKKLSTEVNKKPVPSASKTTLSSKPIPTAKKVSTATAKVNSGKVLPKVSQAKDDTNKKAKESTVKSIKSDPVQETITAINAVTIGTTD